MVMKKLLSALCLTLILSSVSCSYVHGRISYNSRNDPFPIATAASPVGNITTFYDCDSEFRARISFSAYRQNADSAGNCNADTMYDLNATKTDTTRTIIPVNLPIGDMYGPWNLLALFYPELNGNTEVQQKLEDELGLANELVSCTCTKPGGFTPPGDIDKCLERLYAQRNSDIIPAPGVIPLVSNGAPYVLPYPKKTGAMSVPSQYRKYGVRFEADFTTPFDLGLLMRIGVAQMRHVPCQSFRNMTGDYTCCATDDCSCCTDLVQKGIVNQWYVIARTLELDIAPYCESSIDMADIAFYWTHSFEFNHPSETYTTNQPHCTFCPYLMAEFAPPFGKARPPAKLFAPTFGNNHHFGYGLSGGFVFNFFQTIEFGVDVGFTRFKARGYPNQPVPTHILQEGMLPRRADLCIRPGTNWTFGAVMVAYHFLDHFTASTEFRLVHHCRDHVTLLKQVPLSWQTEDDPANLNIEKFIAETGWSTSFVDFGVTYDITPNVALGLLCQLPVRQRNAFRSTTLLGSLVITF